MRLPLLISLLFFVVANSKRLPDIYWNSTNPHLEVCAAVDDLVDIHCPFGKTNEQSIIYRVSKEEYDECRLGEEPREVGRCTEPKVETKLKIAFRSFQANPFAMIYKPDNTYYFISTSSGAPDGVSNRAGGLCTTHALKMKLHVVKKGGSCHVHRKHHSHRNPISTTTVRATVSKDVPVESPYLMPPMEERREEWILTPSQPVQRKDRGEDDPLWDHFYQKVDLTPVREVRTRGERVALDAQASQYKVGDAYEQALEQVLDGQVMFEIHEIGDEPDVLPWRSSGSSIFSSSTTVILLLAVMVLRR